MGVDSYEVLGNEVLKLMQTEGVYAGIDRLERERAAGNIDAATLLGEVYLEGVGVEPDFDRGLQLVGQAASAGNPHANQIIGCAYLDGGYGLRENKELGHAYVEKAANAGLPLSIGRCAADYYWGYGTPVNQSRAMEWAIQGAKLGDYNSNLVCATAFSTGGGATINLPLAIHHYREILRERPDDGHIMAQIAFCLADPLRVYGIIPSQDALSEAYALLSRGVELGSVTAHYYLGVCYANGVAVQRDLNLAHYYIEIAAQNGDSEAQDALGQFRRTMRGEWAI